MKRLSFEENGQETLSIVTSIVGSPDEFMCLSNTNGNCMSKPSPPFCVTAKRPGAT